MVCIIFMLQKSRNFITGQNEREETTQSLPKVLRARTPHGVPLSVFDHCRASVQVAVATSAN
jgi:hypothetical protein